MGQGEVQRLQRRESSQGRDSSTDARAAEELNYETNGLRSKSWDEFAALDSVPLDFVFTVCDQAAAEQCPFWPGQPITAHWGVADPAAFEGSDEEKRRFFLRIYRELENRIKIFSSLRIEALDSFAVLQRVKEIGKVKLPEGSER